MRLSHAERRRNVEDPKWCSRRVRFSLPRGDDVDMRIQIVNFVQEWFSQNVRPPVEVVGSLAVQMTQRAMDEERVRPIVSSQFLASFAPRLGRNVKQRVLLGNKNEWQEKLKRCRPKSRKTPCANYWQGKSSKPRIGRIQNQRWYPLLGYIDRDV
jgi:hypothetical protein